MKTYRRLLWIGIPVLLGIILFTGFLALTARAQENLPPQRAGLDATDASSLYIPVQGLLTDASGNPLEGAYTVTFRIYDVFTGGTAKCEDIRHFNLTDGLFSSYMNAADCDSALDGRQLYLGVEVGSDGEMTPRSYIDNVPYAWGLRPGAIINGALDDESILQINNSGSGAGLSVMATSGEGVNSISVGGPGLFAASLAGPGVVANSAAGTALAVGGTGIITSSAKSYLWISGNDVRPYHQSDSTVIDMDTIGGAKITRGATAGTKNVMLPITIPGSLYGQDVRLTGLDIYWVGQTEFDGFTTVLMRRQVGVCDSCYENIVLNTNDQICDLANNPTGCALHFDLTTNNTLSPDSGIVYLTIEMFFSGAFTYVDLGGVRLTLEHNE